MEQYISKTALVAEIERRVTEGEKVIKEVPSSAIMGLIQAYKNTLSFINTIEVKDPYEQYVQYPSVKDAIQAHAEIYSFNIESLLFNQLTREQQKLWRKEIEQACISGGNVGVGLARDIRYKENVEIKDVDLEKEIENAINEYYNECEKKLQEMNDNDTDMSFLQLDKFAKRFFELGIQVSNKTQKGEKV